MRNFGFLSAGFVLLLVQANLFRLLDPMRPSTIFVAWLLALIYDVLASFRIFRALPHHARLTSTLRAYLSVPLLALLLYAVARSLFGDRLPRPIPSLLLPLIVFMGVHEYSLLRGAAVSFVLGYASDLICIAPVGLFTFTFVASFVLARAAGVRMAAQTPWMQSVVVFAFAAVHSIMILVLMAIFGREKDVWATRQLFPLSVPYAFATAVVAPLVFRLAERIHAATATAQGPQPEGGDS